MAEEIWSAAIEFDHQDRNNCQVDGEAPNTKYIFTIKKEISQRREKGFWFGEISKLGAHWSQNVSTRKKKGFILNLRFEIWF